MGNSTSTWESLCHRGAQEGGSDNLVVLHEAVVKFDNMERQQVELLWRSFTQTASSFAVTYPELETILMVLKDSIGVTDPVEAETEIKRQAHALWNHWTEDARHVGPSKAHVDAMEFLMAVVFLSKMTLRDKINFVFDAIDFDGNNFVDFDEVCISMKSIEAGLTKLRKEPSKPASEMKIILLASAWFSACAGVPHNDENEYPGVVIKRRQFVEFCLKKTQPANVIFRLYAVAEGQKEVDSDVEEEANVALKVADAPAEADPFAALSGGGRGGGGGCAPAEEEVGLQPQALDQGGGRDPEGAREQVRAEALGDDRVAAAGPHREAVPRALDEPPAAGDQ
uniref:EF-hand domain-containing protein n=1 Tax=Phaeomonas parva TaxID=124430 RepID=A0A7S1U3E9_9STRA|mmetsp:Transcript_27002/g.84913  ORF Transcript_27002/g.84913 Transcript_27002/m.84913 type:complete len:339 (+) Transcript_27002:196-1212(+)